MPVELNYRSRLKTPCNTPRLMRASLCQSLEDSKPLEKMVVSAALAWVVAWAAGEATQACGEALAMAAGADTEATQACGEAGDTEAIQDMAMEDGEDMAAAGVAAAGDVDAAEAVDLAVDGEAAVAAADAVAAEGDVEAAEAAVVAADADGDVVMTVVAIMHAAAVSDLAYISNFFLILYIF